MDYKCLFQWVPILLIEGAKESRHTAASMDKVATEIAAGSGSILAKALGLPMPFDARKQLEVQDENSPKS